MYMYAFVAQLWSGDLARRSTVSIIPHVRSCACWSGAIDQRTSVVCCGTCFAYPSLVASDAPLLS